MNAKDIIIEESLTSFFYRNLDRINKNSLHPLPEEFLWYSSEVLSDFAFTQGVVHEKVLGMEFLEAQQKSITEKKKIYKDIGDTTLVQLGLFPQRVNKKAVAESYCINIGKSAYAYLENLDCNFYDIPNFFKLLSTSFESMIGLLSDVREVTKFENFNHYLLSKSPINQNKAS